MRIQKKIALTIVYLIGSVGYLMAQGTYSDYNANWYFGDFVTTGGGGGSVSVDITSNVLSVAFNASFSSTTMNTGKQKQLLTTPILPDMILGSIQGNYIASIEDGWLKVLGSGEEISGFNQTFIVDLHNIDRLELNYVATYAAPTELSSILSSYEYNNMPGYVHEDVQYYDGLGRPTQTVIKRGATNNTKDIISMVEYDAFGREHKIYLPYATSTVIDGFYNPNAITEQDAFYDNLKGVGEGTYAYSETRYEYSALARPIESSGPGIAWNMSTDHTIRKEYKTNLISEEIKYLKANADGSITIGSDYITGELYKDVTLDENEIPNKGEICTYTDKLGRVILKKNKVDNVTFAKTFYIYDDFGLLRYVLQPEGTLEIEYNGEDWTLVNKDEFRRKWMFYYEYDGRQRMVLKQVPGAEPVYMVYDNRDRLVLTQDGNQRSTNVEVVNGAVSKSAYDNTSYLINSEGSLTLVPGFEFTATSSESFIASFDAAEFSADWTYTKYDALNRPVMTGLVHIEGKNHEDLQSEVTDAHFTVDYIGAATGNLYGYATTTIPGQQTDQSLSVTYYDNYDFKSDLAWGTDYDATGYKASVKSLVTGSQTRQLGGSMLKGISYYDSRNRPLVSINENHLGGTEKVTTEYFNVVSPNVKKITRNHSTTGVSKVITQEYTYDHRDRLLTETTTIGGQSSTVTHEYNEIGELVEKNLNGLQSVDYAYNIRGWLTTINGGTTFDDEFDVFGMELQYDLAGQYNGNIGKMQWKSSYGSGIDNEQSYVFQYDGLNRLKKAAYFSTGLNGAYSVFGTDTNGTIGYDLNGNIMNLTRSYDGDNVDALTYSYFGNQLTRVSDSEDDLGPGFNESYSNGDTEDEYFYDPNGNMISDANKGISNITYNYLNLPERVDFANGNYVAYIYDAMGNKLRKETNTGADIDYIAGIQYTDGAIDFVQHSEGRYDFSGGSYLYDIKDHLGNSRVTIDGGASSVSTTSLYQNSSTQQSGFISFSSTAVAQGDELTLTFEAIPSNVMGLAIEMFVTGSTGTQYEVQTDEGTTYTSYHQFTFTFDVTMAGPTNVTFYIHDIGGGGMSIKNISLTKQDVTVSVSQRDDYYPFGGLFNSYAVAPENKYLFQGQEHQDETGWDQFKWRMHDPWLGRFISVDPLADKYVHNSPYAFAENKVMTFIELEGLEGIHYMNGNGGHVIEKNVVVLTRQTSSNFSDKKNARIERQNAAKVEGVRNELNSFFGGAKNSAGESVEFKFNVTGMAVENTDGGTNAEMRQMGLSMGQESGETAFEGGPNQVAPAAIITTDGTGGAQGLTTGNIEVSVSAGSPEGATAHEVGHTLMTRQGEDSYPSGNGGLMDSPPGHVTSSEVDKIIEDSYERKQQ